MQLKMLFHLNNLFIVIILTEFVLNAHPNHIHSPFNPCPNVFAYKYDGRDWYGEIKATTNVQQQSFMLNVTFLQQITRNVSELF